MTTAVALWLLPTVAVIAFVAGAECCWRLFVRYRDPNPFGELPPVHPLGAVVGDESTQYFDVDVVTRRLEPIGIATITMRHNQPEARN